MSTEELNETPIIDQEQLDMLIMAGEDAAAEMIQELLELFEEETGPKVNELLALADESEPERHRLARLSHSIAGSSANIGGLRLSKACRSLEQEIPSIDFSAASQRAQFIKETYTCTVSSFREELQKLA